MPTPRHPFAASRRSRLPIFAMAVSALAITLTACGGDGGGGDGGGDGSDGDAAEGPVTITWWDYYQPGAQEDAVVGALDEYEATHSGVTIDRQFIAYDDLKQSLLQSAGASALPDIAIINGPDHQAFAELGIAADLTDRFDEFDLYPEGAIESASLDGRIYGLPITANTLALFYNTDMLEEAGVEPPTTWEDMSSVAAALTTSDRYGLAYSAVNNQQAVFQWLPTLWQAGGDLTDLGAPEATEALEFWAGLMNDGSVSREALNWDQAQVAAEFGQGRAAMMINGPWQIPFLATEAPDLDYGVALLPTHTESASALGGENYLVVDGPNQDAALDLLTWLQQPDQVAALAEGTGSLPTRSDVPPFSDDPSIATFTEQLQVAQPRAYGADYAEIADHVVVAIQSALSGTASAEDALADAADAVEPLMDQ